MRHDEIRRKLAAFADSEVTEAEKTIIEEHIKGCNGCREEFKAFAGLDKELKQVSGLEVPVHFRSKLQAHLNDAAKKEAVFSLRYLLPVPALLSLFILVFSFYFASAPLIYGESNQDVKGKTAGMYVKTMAAAGAGSIFAPLNFAAFCDNCSQAMCACCSGKPGATKCLHKNGGC